MNIGEAMWREFKTLKQELLDLKQMKPANCASKYYIFEIPASAEYYAYWRITYKDGTQPIIAEVLSDATTSLSSPSGNTQYLFAYSQMSSMIKILSTREIESVVGVE